MASNKEFLLLVAFFLLSLPLYRLVGPVALGILDLNHEMTSLIRCSFNGSTASCDAIAHYQT